MSQEMSPGPGLGVSDGARTRQPQECAPSSTMKLNEAPSFLLLPPGTVGLHPAPGSPLPDLELWDLDHSPDPWFPSLVPAFTPTTLLSVGLKRPHLGICARAEGLGSSSLPVPTLGSPGEGLDCCHHPQTVPTLRGISYVPLLFLYSPAKLVCPVPYSLQLLGQD